MKYRELEPEEHVFDKGTIITRLKEFRKRYEDTYGVLKEAFKVKFTIFQEREMGYMSRKLEGTLDKDEHPPVKPDMPVKRDEDYELWITFYEAAESEFVILSREDFAHQWMDKWDFVRRHVQTMMAWASDFSSATTSTTSTSTALASLNAAIASYE